MSLGVYWPSIILCVLLTSTQTLPETLHCLPHRSRADAHVHSFAPLSITGSHTLTFLQTLYNTTSLLVREEKDVSAQRALFSGEWQ